MFTTIIHTLRQIHTCQEAIKQFACVVLYVHQSQESVIIMTIVKLNLIRSGVRNWLKKVVRGQDSP